MMYATLTRSAGPLLRRHLRNRTRRGKEDPARIGERYGEATVPRPDGPLVWFHAASVGEGVALLGLIAAVLARYPATSALVTSGTVTSAQVLAGRLPERAMHQYVPLDHPVWVERFLDHWKPDAVIWTESEIWPNLLRETACRGIPAAMVNARLSARSARFWKLQRRGFARLLSGFAVRLAQSEADLARLASFGVSFRHVGNLKLAAEPAPVDPAALQQLVRAIGNRPFWLAASTHEGEETIALTVHRRLAQTRPDLLTIIVPRHPARGNEVAALAEAEGLCLDRRSSGALPDNQTAIYLADTIGELGTFYRLTPVAFIGGSFAHGGHSAVEAAHSAVAIVYGPDMRNNASIAAALESVGGSRRIGGAGELAAVLAGWLDNPGAAELAAQAAKALVEEGREIVGRIMAELQPIFTRARLR